MRDKLHPCLKIEKIVNSTHTDSISGICSTFSMVKVIETVASKINDSGQIFVFLFLITLRLQIFVRAMEMRPQVHISYDKKTHTPRIIIKLTKLLPFYSFIYSCFCSSSATRLWWFFLELFLEFVVAFTRAVSMGFFHYCLCRNGH